MSTEGVDYSRGGFPGSAALTAHGKHFAGRYAVSDLSPQGRGITPGEYNELTHGGIETYLYWEAEESWMLGGWSRGVAAANDALANIRRAGMPEGMPVYYSHDIEPQTQHYAAIDDCLRGAASVVGIGRVGIYGGYWLMEHCAQAGTARWFCQTWAWSGSSPDPWQRSISEDAHLYQYETRNVPGTTIGGVNVDLVRALKPHYGQAGDFLAHPTTTTTAAPVDYPPHRIPAPDAIHAQGHELVPNKPNRFNCIQGTTFRTAPSLDAPAATKTPAKAGRSYTFDYRTKVDGADWLVSKAGSWAMAKNFEVA